MKWLLKVTKEMVIYARLCATMFLSHTNGLFGCAKKRWLGLAQERLTAQLFGSPRPAERLGHTPALLPVGYMPPNFCPPSQLPRRDSENQCVL